MNKSQILSRLLEVSNSYNYTNGEYAIAELHKLIESLKQDVRTEENKKSGALKQDKLINSMFKFNEKNNHTGLLGYTAYHEGYVFTDGYRVLFTSSSLGFPEAESPFSEEVLDDFLRVDLTELESAEIDKGDVAVYLKTEKARIKALKKTTKCCDYPYHPYEIKFSDGKSIYLNPEYLLAMIKATGSVKAYTDTGGLYRPVYFQNLEKGVAGAVLKMRPAKKEEEER